MQQAREKGRVYKIAKLMCGSYSEGTDAPIMDKQGRLLMTEAEQDAQWTEHHHQQRQIYKRQRQTWMSTRSPRKRRDHSSHQVPQERKIPWTK